MRVQRLLAMAGVASRRKCEDLIREGRVKVNGKVVSLGAQASETDDVRVDGKKIKVEKKRYILFNKPKGVVCTLSSPFGSTTLPDIIKVKEHIFPVGRLDKNTTGLLLLTNDGKFAQKLAHPSFEVEKEYVAILDRAFKDVKKLKSVSLDGRKVDVRKVKVGGKKVTLVIHEGRKHVVRRIFDKLGYSVVELKRTRVGPFRLGSLKEGDWRDLSSREVSLVIDQ